MKKFLMLCLVILGGLGSVAEALPNEYNYYKPEQIYRRLKKEFTKRGISAVKAEWVGSAGVYLPKGAEALVVDDGIIGQVTFTANPQLNKYAMHITDTENNVLINVTEDSKPCSDLSAGLCHRINFFPANEVVEGKPAPFSVVIDGGGLAYQRYGSAINVSQWRYQFNDSFNWLLKAVCSLPNDKYSYPSTLRDRLLRALNSEPAVAANLKNIAVIWVEDHFVVRGYVPNTAVYNLLVRRVMSAGVPGVRIEVDIYSLG